MIKKLVIKNFRNLKNVEYELDKTNIFSGINGIGKTNVICALYWLLTDEIICDDITKSKQIDTIIDVLNPRETVEVIAELEDDTILSKKFFQKWSRTRGTTEEKYEGNTTERFLNNSLVKESDWFTTVLKCFKSNYDCKTKGVNPISALVDVNYLLNKLDPKVLRQYISNLVGDVTNDDVIKRNPQYAKLNDLFRVATPEQVRTSYVTKVNSYNKQIETKKGEINALSNLFDATKEIQLKAEIETLENQQGLFIRNPLIDELKAQKIEAFKKADELLLQKRNTEEELSKSVLKDITIQTNPKEVENQLGIDNLTKEIQKLKNEGQIKQSTHERNKILIKGMENDILNVETNIIKKRKEIKDLYESSYQEKRCPCCNELLNANEVDSFLSTKAKSIEDAKQDIEVLEERIVSIRKQLLPTEKAQFKLYEEMAYLSQQIREKQVGKEKLEIELEVLQNQPEERIISEETKAFERALERLTSNHEMAFKSYAELSREILGLELADITKQQQYQNEIKAQLSPLREELTQVLVAKENANKLIIAEGELKEIYKSQAGDETTLLLVDTFIKDKIKMLNEKTSLYFDNIEFVMLEEQKNGGLKEVCYPMLNGVPYQAINTSDKALIGLSIINSIKHNLSLGDLPIIFDKAESLDNMKLAQMEYSQLIATKVDSYNYQIKLERLN